MSCYAIIPAAGLGTRLGADGRGRSKALVELADGVSLLELSLRNLLGAGVCTGIAVAVRPVDREPVSRLLRRVAPGISHSIVDGGDTRQGSVFNALRDLAGKAASVVVHDAARPFVEARRVQECVTAAERHGAAILACPVISTLKQVNSEGHSILRTIPRTSVWEAQTPQCFSFAILYRAHTTARETGFMGTDDSELVERLGYPVAIVRGSSLNLKITTPEDLEVARRLLRLQSEP